MSIEPVEANTEIGLSRRSVPAEQEEDELNFDDCTFGNGAESSGPSFTSKLVSPLP